MLRALSLGFGFALAAASAAAQTPPRVVALSIAGENRCALSPSASERTDVSAGNRNVGGSGTSFTIDQLTNETSLSTNRATLRVAFDGICNSPHRLTVTSDNNGLWRVGSQTAQSRFATAVPYDVAVAWGGQSYDFQFDAAARRAQDRFALVESAARGDMIVEINIAQGATNLNTNSPLAAGLYGDTLRITVGPQ